MSKITFNVTDSTAENKHLTILDQLRGFAVFAVVLFHYYSIGFEKYRQNFEPIFAGTEKPDWLYLALYPLRFGAYGVATFFVLSGYLIHKSYLNSKN